MNMLTRKEEEILEKVHQQELDDHDVYVNKTSSRAFVIIVTVWVLAVLTAYFVG